MEETKFFCYFSFECNNVIKQRIPPLPPRLTISGRYVSKKILSRSSRLSVGKENIV